MTVTDLVFVAMATFAWTFMLIYVGGPFDVFKKIRLVVNNTFPKYFVELYGCFWCLGFWVGLVMLGLYISIPWIVYPFCVLGLAGFMHEVLG